MSRPKGSQNHSDDMVGIHDNGGNNHPYYASSYIEQSQLYPFGTFSGKAAPGIPIADLTALKTSRNARDKVDLVVSSSYLYGNVASTHPPGLVASDIIVGTPIMTKKAHYDIPIENLDQMEFHTMPQNGVTQQDVNDEPSVVMHHQQRQNQHHMSYQQANQLRRNRQPTNPNDPSNNIYVNPQESYHMHAYNNNTNTMPPMNYGVYRNPQNQIIPQNYHHGYGVVENQAAMNMYYPQPMNYLPNQQLPPMQPMLNQQPPLVQQKSDTTELQMSRSKSSDDGTSAVTSDNPKNKKKTPATKGRKRKASELDEDGSDEDDGSSVATRVSNKSPADSEEEEGEGEGEDDELHKRRHRESETRRRSRLRDQFSQLNDLVKCPKKTRAQILNSAVTQLQQYKERIRQLEEQVARQSTSSTSQKSSTDTSSNAQMPPHPTSRPGRQRQRDIVLNDKDAMRGVGRFRDTYSPAGLISSDDYSQHNSPHNSMYFSNQNNSSNSSLNSVPHPNQSCDPTARANYHHQQQQQQQQHVGLNPTTAHISHAMNTVNPIVPALSMLPEMPLQCDPSEINRVEPQDPTMAAVVSAFRDQLSPLVSISKGNSTSTKTNSNHSSPSIDKNTPSNSSTPPIASHSSFPNSSSTTSSTSSTESNSPIYPLPTEVTTTSPETTTMTESYVRPPCMPVTSAPTDMPPCMKGPNANTIRARTCLITGKPACTPALLSIHHPLIANVAICIIGLDSRFVDCNMEFEKIVGTSRDNLTSATLLQRTHPEELGHVIGVFKRMLDGSVSVWESVRRVLTDEKDVYRTIKFTLTSVKVARHPLFFVGFCLPEGVGQIDPIPGVTESPDGDITIGMKGKTQGCIYYRPPPQISTSHSITNMGSINTSTSYNDAITQSLTSTSVHNNNLLSSNGSTSTFDHSISTPRLDSIAIRVEDDILHNTIHSTAPNSVAFDLNMFTPNDDNDTGMLRFPFGTYYSLHDYDNESSRGLYFSPMNKTEQQDNTTDQISSSGCYESCGGNGKKTCNSSISVNQSSKHDISNFFGNEDIL